MLIFATSCAKENLAEENQGDIPKPEINNEYVVSVDFAVDELNAFLDLTKDGLQTRGGGDRKIKNIETVNLTKPSTRTGGTEVTPMVYIVSFEDDGYAVLGADVRAPGIIAISDEGSLGMENFAYKQFESESILGDVTNPSSTRVSGAVDPESIEATHNVSQEEFPYLLALFINACVQDAIAEFTASGVDSRGVYIQGKNWDFVERIDTKVRTTWGQSDPFNREAVKLNGGKNVAAGCAAVALAQVCTYNEFPKKDGTFTFPYWDIKQVYSHYQKGGAKSYGTETQKGYAAKLISVCGIKAKTKYGAESSTSVENAADAMRQMGYQNVSIRKRSNTIIDENVRTALRNNCPVYYRGERYVGGLDWSGHAWVVDGLWRLKSGSETLDLNHCNFGWTGKHNGWYREGMFNTSRNMYSYTPNDGDIYKPNDLDAGRNYSIRQ